MRISILTAFVLVAGVCYAAVTRTPIKSGVALKPGQTYTVTLDSATPVEVGWIAVQVKACSMHCVQATELTQPGHNTLATDAGASTFYNPSDGKISIEYKNVSDGTVVINIHRVQRTCEAEACKFIDKEAKPRPLVFKIKEFKSVATSKDGSYSTISGVAMSGRPFVVHAVWWTDDPNSFRFDCDKAIKRWLENHDAPEKYRPYVLGGWGARR